MARNAPAPASSQAGFLVTLFASTFLMASSFVAGKILLQQGFTPMILVGWRFFVAALATLPLVLAGERNIVAALLPAKAGLRDVALVILIGLLQTAAVMGLLFWAMQFISASTAAILLFTKKRWCNKNQRISVLGSAVHGHPCVFHLGHGNFLDAGCWRNIDRPCFMASQPRTAGKKSAREG